MVLILLAIVLFAILSIGYPILTYYLYVEWDRYNGTIHDGYAERCLYGMLVLVAYMLFGRFLIMLILSKRRKGEEEPCLFNTDKSEVLVRPDGTRINIEYYGKESGQTIIFVHGWNATSNEWYYQKKYFEKDYRIILIDLPGLGKSTRPSNKDFSLHKMAQDLNAVIEYSNTKNPILWGHSIGGMTILTLLAKHKEAIQQNIKGIILQHTTYTNPVRTIILSKLLFAIQKPILIPLCYLLIGLSPIIWIARWMSYLNGGSHLFTRFLLFTGTQSPRQLDFITLQSTLAPPAVMARGVLGMFKYDVTRELPTIKVSALIIAAKEDRLTKPTASEYMADMLPNAKMVVVAPGGHQGLIERHKEVNEAAESFIRGLN